MPERRSPRWGCLVVLVVLAVAAWFGWREFQAHVRANPERFPWTPLSLADPVGPFTARKLAALTGDPAQCRALLAQAGDRDRPAPAISSGSSPECGYADGMTIVTETDTPEFAPTGVVTSCPVAAALRLWLPSIQQAAQRHLGSRVTRIDHFGSYSCRRLYGSDGPWSEHATADALDIAGFRFADGRRVTVAGDWTGDDSEAAFLRAVRTSACDLYATVLSPDYNEAHRDHLHLDQAERGARGGSLCR